MTEEILRCYRVLELRPGSSPAATREAYLDLVKVWHPDRFGSDVALQQKAQEKLKEINVAYDWLRSAMPEELQPEPPPAPPPVPGPPTIHVDRFVFCGDCCDEITVHSRLRDSDGGRGTASLAFVNIMTGWAQKQRAVDYVLAAGPPLCLVHTDLADRRIVLNKSLPVSQKAVVFPLALFYIRDTLRGGAKKDKEGVIRCLKLAGWRGATPFASEDYLTAEVVLGNEAAEDVLDRISNRPKRAGFSGWFSDVKTWHSGPNSLQDSGRWLSYQINYAAAPGSRGFW